MSSYKENLTECPKGCDFKLPHFHRKFNPEIPKIAQNILEVVGNTPLVKLNKIPQSFGLKCDILVKCEYLNPGGSIKDRAGYNMILMAEQLNKLNKHDKIVEATSGNTGVGMALANTVKGYKTIITMNDKMSIEKEIALKVLGAKVIRTPYALPASDPGHYVQLAKRLALENPNIKFLNQYENCANPLAHFDITAEEILYQTDNKLDIMVVAAGTGGTITGISKKLKAKLPSCKVIGVDPYGSVLAQPETLNYNSKGQPYLIEGVGQTFIPKTLESELIDEWVKTNDKDSFDMSLRLCKEEGILVGGSSGTALCGAIEYCRKYNLGEGKRIVVIMPDGIRNYLKKFCDDDWMISQKLLSLSVYTAPNSKANELTLQQLNLKPVKVFKKDLTFDEALKIFKETKKHTIIIVDDQERMIGIVKSQQVLKGITKDDIKLTDTIIKVFSDSYAVFCYNDISMDQLSTLCEKYNEVYLEKKVIKNVYEYYIVDSFDFLQNF